MKTSLIAYDLCRHYLMDRRTTLLEVHVKQIEGYLRSRDISRLATISDSLSPLYNTAESIRTIRQISAFFKKHRDLANDDNCRQAAIATFKACERRCSITNRRLDYYFCTQPDRLDPDLSLKITKMKAWISSTLGPFDRFLEELPQLVRITSGASSTRSRRKSLPHLKVSKRLACTPASFPYLQALSSLFGYGALKMRPTLWNRVEAVRKNWKTHRIIACEPVGNLPLQLAFDTYAKRRLLRKGIDLRDQFRNQAHALEGSIHGKLATVDFSSASDLIAFNVPALLFEQGWFDYLASVRSPMYKLGDSHYVKPYHKFSSMGNGSTFCIETLVFAAACHAVGSKNFSVYGDDVIIEPELFDAFDRLTRFLGFRINREKSFTTGFFRESCGKDYYAGTDVTPFYLRYEDGRKPTLCHIVNSCAPLAEFGSLWNYLKGLVASEKLPFVPHSLNTMAGVWLYSSHSYQQGLIKRRGQVSYYRGYSTKSRVVKVWDIRALFLWYLSNQRFEPAKTSKFSLLPGSYVPTSTERYSRKWVVWNPTHGWMLQSYLYGWSSYLTS